MEMQFKNEINKLADVVVWADGIIRDAGYNEEKYKSDGSTAYCHVKAHELWRIRDVALKSIERHAVYTNALNNDIADKAAKIDLLEKEIEGRKEGYIALKERMDTKCISIEEHNNICEEFKNKIAELENEIEGRKKTIKLLDEKVERQRENLNALNKTLEIRTKENERLIAVKNNQDKEIEAHENENKRLSERIIELKKENSYLKKELNETCTCKELDLKGHNRREMALVNDLADKNDEIKKLEESIDYYKNQERIRTDQLRATERKVDELWGLVNELKKEKGEIAFRIRSEVDKKRIVDIGEGAEKILGVSRELFDAAIKALVDVGYQEIIGRIPQATNSYVYMDMHVLATPDVETKETANAENIKSLDFDIPCGEDSIE